MQSKWFVVSKTFWGIFIASMGIIAGQFGLDWWAVAEGPATDIFNNLLTAAGAGWALWGLRSAKSDVTLTPGGRK